MHKINAPDSRPPYVLLAVFVLLCLGIIASGFLHYQNYIQRFRNEEENQLSAITNLKIFEIMQWRKERLGNGAVILQNPAFSSLVRRYYADSRDGQARDRIKAWLAGMQEHYQYDAICLLDARGGARLYLPDRVTPVSAKLLKLIPDAVRSKKIIFQDFYRNEHDGRIYLAVMVPITGAGEQVLGALALRIDPRQYLYPLISRWPTPSGTAETLLIRRSGSDALFLNPLKYKADAALTLRIPLTEQHIPAVMAALGREGVIEGVDYRNEPVLADVRRVPGSPWFMVARMDMQEVYAPVQDRFWETVVLIAALLLSMASVLLFFWRQQRVRFYRSRLREQAWLRDVFSHSFSEVYAIDPKTLQFKFANQGALRNTGFSRDELAGLGILDVNPAYTQESFRSMLQPLLAGEREVLIFETLHRRRDGSEYPVEVHLQLIAATDGAVLLAVVNDITERKLAQEKDRLSLSRLQSLVRIFQHTSETVREFLDDALAEAMSLTGSQFGYIYFYSEEKREFVLNTWSPGVMAACSVIEPQTVYELDKTGLWGEAVRQRRPIMINDFKAPHPFKKGYPEGHVHLHRFLTVPVISDGRIVAVIGVANKAEDYDESDTLQLTLLLDAVWEITERRQAAGALKAELAERRRVERALQDSESLLSEARRKAHLGTWVYNIETGVFHGSDELRRILGLHEDTAMSFGEFASHVHPDDYALLAVAWDDDFQASTSKELEYRIIRPSGEVRFIHDYTIYKYNESGNLAGLASLLLDITERKLAEDKLRQLSQAVEQSPALIVITDPTGAIEYVNPKFVELTGYTAEEVLGKNPRLLKSGDKPPEAYRELWQTITAGGQWRGEFLNRKKNGELYWEGASLSPIRDASGRIVHFLAVKEDITERKRAVENLRDANRQLEVSIARANAMATQAELANLAKSEFLANMSHEIRTPMNGVIGMTGLLLDSELTDEQRQFAQIVRSSGEALLGLINDILDLSKIEAGKLDLEMLDFDLRATLEDTAELLSVKAREKGLELACLVEPDVPVLLQGDPGRLRQILINLGGNAVKFTEAGGVTLRSSLDAEDESRVTVRFSITDTGIGIPLNKQKDIFSPFTQVDGSTTRKYGGTGLGLSISRHLADLMGGSIGLESRPRKGSTFWFTAVFTKQAAGRLSEPPPMADLKGVRVLVVDDHRINRLLVTTLLKSWGCRFAEAVDAESAIERLHGAASQHDPYSIALIDLHMPGMNGAELGRRIKASAAIAETHLIMMTSLGERGDAGRFMALGFEGYLNKPLRQLQLHDCMALVLGKARMRLEQKGASPLITRHTISEARKRRLRILIAEDNETNQFVALKILEKLGYRADIVADGAEAVAALRTTAYDLVLMDCQMPRLDGFDATRRIRSPKSEVLNTRVPVIAMTAHAMKGDREKCLAVGMDDYLSKPLDSAKLSAMLAAWLQDTGRADGPKETGPAPGREGGADTQPAVFDYAAFRARMLEDEEMMSSIIRKFLDDMPVQLEKLAAAAEAGDCDQARQLGHRIKGAAANMAAEALRAAAADMEQAGRAGSTGDVRRVLAEMQQCFANVHDVLAGSVLDG